jgi:hypothetical protein
VSSVSVNYALRAIPSAALQLGRAWIALDRNKGRALGISTHRIHSVHVPDLELGDNKLALVSPDELKELAQKNTRKAWSSVATAVSGERSITASALSLLDSSKADSFGITTVGEIKAALEEQPDVRGQVTGDPISLFELTSDGELLLNGVEIGSSLGKLPSSRALNTRYLKAVLAGGADTQVGIGMQHGSSSDIAKRSWRGWSPVRFQLLGTPYMALVAPMSYP